MKKILIDQIRVTLEPLYSASKCEVELRLCVKTLGKELYVSQILADDDLESRFDYYLDRIKEEMRDALKKHAIAQEPAVTP